MAVGICFSDSASAYYRVDKSILFRGDAKAAPEGFSEQAKALIDGGGVLRDVAVPDYLVQAWREVLDGSWFVIEGQGEVATTQRGSKLGDPGADLLFGFLDARCTRDMRQRLQGASISATVPWPGLQEALRSEKVLEGDPEHSVK